MAKLPAFATITYPDGATRTVTGNHKIEDEDGNIDEMANEALEADQKYYDEAVEKGYAIK